jgi:hypothetical protein
MKTMAGKLSIKAMAKEMDDRRWSSRDDTTLILAVI